MIKPLCGFSTVSSNLWFILSSSHSLKGEYQFSTKAQKEFIMILFSFLEECDNDVNFLSSSQAFFSPFPSAINLQCD